MDVEQFLRLKKMLAQLKEQNSKLQGGREILLERLKKEFGCSTVQEAKSLLSSLQEELSEKSKSYSDRASLLEKELNSKCKR